MVGVKARLRGVLGLLEVDIRKHQLSEPGIKREGPTQFYRSRSALEVSRLRAKKAEQNLDRHNLVCAPTSLLPCSLLHVTYPLSKWFPVWLFIICLHFYTLTNTLQISITLLVSPSSFIIPLLPFFIPIQLKLDTTVLTSRFHHHP